MEISPADDGFGMETGLGGNGFCTTWFCLLPLKRWPLYYFTITSFFAIVECRDSLITYAIQNIQFACNGLISWQLFRHYLNAFRTSFIVNLNA